MTDKNIDESWKEKAEAQKADPQAAEDKAAKPEAAKEQAAAQPEGSDEYQVDFTNYVTSLGFQAMIFLGEIPHPVSNQTEKNLKQAKFLIDTMVLLRDKTKGNLTEQENAILEAAIYELQMKYVEILQKEGKS